MTETVKAPWTKCDCCPEFWCNIHGMHASECSCPPVEEWGDVDPYGTAKPPALDFPALCASLDAIAGRGEIAREVRASQEAIDALMAKLPRPPQGSTISSLMGLPVVFDPGMEPGAWGVVSTRGKVMAEGNVRPALRVIEGGEAPAEPPTPLGHCPKCLAPWYSAEGFCGGCEGVGP